MGSKRLAVKPYQFLAKLVMQRKAAVFFIAFAVVGGAILLFITHAASPYASSQAENGVLGGAAITASDTNASGGSYVKFGSGGGGTGTCPSLPLGVGAAFCDTFDAPAGTGNRSGQLNGNLWGVSRMLAQNNFGGQQYDIQAPTDLRTCSNGTQSVYSPNDVIICNGQLREATNDNPFADFDAGGVSVLAMYPKQPFDWASATSGSPGIVSFDISNDTSGNHGAWPEFWISDKPVPAPFTHFDSLQQVPQQGFGIRFAGGAAPGQFGSCPNTNNINSPRWTIDSAIVIRNYAEEDHSIFGPSAGLDFGTNTGMTVTAVDCVIQPANNSGVMNRVQIKIMSQNQIQVWASDAGQTTTREIAVINGANLQLTRGLVWMEDAHYNADKATNQPYPNSQREHTFVWDNLGFNGPVLGKDLTFDVLDSLTPTQCGGSGTGCKNLGWLTPTTSGPPPANTTNTLKLDLIGNVTQANKDATNTTVGPFLVLNYFTYSPVTLYYRVNGGSWQSKAYPYPTCLDTSVSPPIAVTLPTGHAVLCGGRTLSLPVTMSDIHVGTNNVEFTSTDQTSVENVDLIMPGAG